jgi:hypothetical protein
MMKVASIGKMRHMRVTGIYQIILLRDSATPSPYQRQSTNTRTLRDLVYANILEHTRGTTHFQRLRLDHANSRCIFHNVEDLILHHKSLSSKANASLPEYPKLLDPSAVHHIQYRGDSVARSENGIVGIDLII